MKGGGRRKNVSSVPTSPGNDEAEYNMKKREQQQQQQLNDVGDEYDKEEEEEDRDDYGDQFGDLEMDGGGGAIEGEGERPKLAEGFYEIQTVRRKRIRKGEVQYLIKWRDWPETANTWEPVENLTSCSDFIDAFEESMKQRSNRKRKRKNGVAPRPQSKKKQQHSPVATHEEPSPVNNFSFDNGTQSNIVDMGNAETPKQLDDDGSLMVKERNESNVKLSEIKDATFAKQENVIELAIDIQEDRETKEVIPANGISISQRVGAKRRKCGAVKRFKQDADSSVTNQTQEATENNTSSSIGPIGNGLDTKIKVETSRSMYEITKIIKPIDYSTSMLNDTQDVSVTFTATSSAGKEVIVDNKFLKANNPLLLISFYEQHLRHINSSE